MLRLSEVVRLERNKNVVFSTDFLGYPSIEVLSEYLWDQENTSQKEIYYKSNSMLPLLSGLIRKYCSSPYKEQRRFIEVIMHCYDNVPVQVSYITIRGHVIRQAGVIRHPDTIKSAYDDIIPPRSKFFL